MSRRICTKCNKPIMVIESKPVTELGSIEIYQVTKLGCLNEECEKKGIVVDTISKRIDTN